MMPVYLHCRLFASMRCLSFIVNTRLLSIRISPLHPHFIHALPQCILLENYLPTVQCILNLMIVVRYNHMTSMSYHQAVSSAVNFLLIINISPLHSEVSVVSFGSSRRGTTMTSQLLPSRHGTHSVYISVIYILESTTSLYTSSRTSFVCVSVCPRHVERRVT